MSRGRVCLLGLSLVGGCADPQDRPAAPDRGDEPAAVPAPAQLRRLTDAEYRNTLVDLFGEDLVLPVSLEPDLEVDGLVAVGAAQAAISPLGVERYEDAAYLVAEQVAEPGRRSRFADCAQPAGPGGPDDACAEAILGPLARLAWRRAPTDEELGTLVSLSRAASAALGGFDQGLAYGVAAALQSPSFLYRVEVGEGGRFSATELASRMSYLLWAGPPDDALLALGEDGALLDPEVRRAEAERMLDDPRARRGLRAWLDDWLGLDTVPSLAKDPTLFEHWGDGVGLAAREQTLATFEWLVFEAEGDVRDVMTTRTAVLDRSLAALYGVPAPTPEGFARTELPAGPRAGLLGQASFLARQAHSVSTSVTRRGLFVHTTLLCREIPPPPANVDTSIPEPSEDAPTMRDRVAEHLENPMCASCHEVTDPVGLAFEQFDGIGRFRTTENGVTIDASGNLDDVAFDDAAGLARALRGHPDLTACLAETALRYAQGHPLSLDEAELAGWHERGLAEAGYRWQALLLDLIAADAFAVAAGEAL
jgi:hypothetical protein